MRIVFVAGMIAKKLESKIIPLQLSGLVEEIYLIRRYRYTGPKITCISPQGIISRSYILSELYRVISIISATIKYKPEVLIAAGFMPHFLYISFLNLFLRKRTILLLMGQTEIDLSYPAVSFFRKMMLKAAFSADYIGVRGTNSMKIVARHGYDTGKIFIPHNVFDFNKYLPGKVKDPPYDLLFLGNLHPEKRLDILLEIVRLTVRDYIPELSVVIAGTGQELKRLQNIVSRDGLTCNVKFHAFADEQQINELLSNTKIVVLTSETEGLPMTIVEAFSSGTPVVAFNAGDISDILKDGTNGFLIDFGDTDRFVKCTVNLLRDDEVYKGISDNCLKIRGLYCHEYSAENIMHVWESVLKEIQ